MSLAPAGMTGGEDQHKGGYTQCAKGDSCKNGCVWSAIVGSFTLHHLSVVLRHLPRDSHGQLPMLRSQQPPAPHLVSLGQQHTHTHTALHCFTQLSLTGRMITCVWSHMLTRQLRGQVLEQGSADAQPRPLAYPAGSALWCTQLLQTHAPSVSDAHHACSSSSNSSPARKCNQCMS